MAHLVYNKDWPQNKEFLNSPLNAKDRFTYLERKITPIEIRYLKTLEYEIFLQSLYWIILREYLFVLRGHKCQVCEKDGVLNVHHLSYDHRGIEYKHLDDLIILCKECHEAQHMEVSIDKVIAILASKKSAPRLWHGKKNPNYNPDWVNHYSKEDLFNGTKKNARS